jgi:hypothetical protein
MNPIYNEEKYQESPVSIGLSGFPGTYVQGSQDMAATPKFREPEAGISEARDPAT